MGLMGRLFSGAGAGAVGVGDEVVLDFGGGEGVVLDFFGGEVELETLVVKF